MTCHHGVSRFEYCDNCARELLAKNASNSNQQISKLENCEECGRSRELFGRSCDKHFFSVDMASDRENARDKFYPKVKTHGDREHQIEQSWARQGFNAGWDARNDEIVRLRSGLEMIKQKVGTSSEAWHIAHESLGNKKIRTT